MENVINYYYYYHYYYYYYYYYYLDCRWVFTQWYYNKT
jgi:hypothetical protein